MTVEIGTETPIFLFWEYLFRNFGILSLLCSDSVLMRDPSLIFRILLLGSLTSLTRLKKDCIAYGTIYIRAADID